MLQAPGSTQAYFILEEQSTESRTTSSVVVRCAWTRCTMQWETSTIVKTPDLTIPALFLGEFCLNKQRLERCREGKALKTSWPNPHKTTPAPPPRTEMFGAAVCSYPPLTSNLFEDFEKIR